MDRRIVFIIPNTKVVETIHSVLREAGEEYPVVYGSTEGALETARQMQKKGTCVVVSMGTTARYLQRRMSIPVLEMPFSNIEFISAIKQALRYSNKILLVSSSNVGYSVQQCLAVFEDIGATIDVREYLPNRPLPEQAEEFLLQGNYEVVISSTPGVEAALRLGKIGILHDIDPKMVQVSLANARALVQVEENRRQSSRMVQAIIEYSPEGLVSVDAGHCVTVMNRAAERLIGLNVDEARGKTIEQIFLEQHIVDILGGAEPVGPEHSTFVVVQKVPLPEQTEHGGELLLIRDAGELHDLNLRAQKNLGSKGHIAKRGFADIVGDSQELLHAKYLARTFAAYDSTVLIVGETGTGKELFAQSIHNESPRRKQPFVAINCAALPEALLESELFGYVKGAFTGARGEGKAGVFEMANTGTLFLDEIGEISLAVQARLLRVLQEKEIMRIGDDLVRSIDVRVVSATNRDLHALIREGRFREDLYYRLCVLEVRIPALRERPGDIEATVSHLMRRKNRQLGTSVTGLSPEVLEWMVKQEWRGNVRELENLLEKLLILTREGTVGWQTLQQSGYAQRQASDAAVRSEEEIEPLRVIERRYIEQALDLTHGNRSACARRLGIDAATLWRKLK